MSFVRLYQIIALGFCALITLTIPGVVTSQDESLSRTLLIKLSRDQYQTLCGSEVFTQCMGFSQQQCLSISEDAIEQCLTPLPERIALDQLDNELIEACPRQVYEDAGYSEEKAAQCFDQAYKASEQTGEQTQ